MDIILLENVTKLGQLGDQVKVKAGYGRNYLIPFGKAVPATKANIDSFSQRRVELEKAAAERLAVAKKRSEAVADVELTLAVKAGDGGKLFGSIGTRDLADLISSTGVEIQKSEIRLPGGTIRQIGTYEIDLQLHPEVQASLTVHVVPEE
jgi:large subunit ribosomal protein L9